MRMLTRDRFIVQAAAMALCSPVGWLRERQATKKCTKAAEQAIMNCKSHGGCEKARPAGDDGRDTGTLDRSR